jgi:tetratricopeptide (TPR) repeat protein
VILIGLLLMTSCSNNQDPIMLPASKTTAHNDSILAKVAVLMDAGDFENAQQILLKSLDETKSQTNQYDQYFLHTYLAEVMYYTALNEQGLQNAVKALKISQSINNDTLIGNAHNLLGLIHLNRERLESGNPHFLLTSFSFIQVIRLVVNKPGCVVPIKNPFFVLSML